MSTSPAREAPAPGPEKMAAKADEIRESGRAQTPQPSETTKEAEPPSAEAKDGSPSASKPRSEGECSGSESPGDKPSAAPQGASEAAAKADETQPPLPDEPLPEHDGPPLPNEPPPSDDPAAPPLPAEPVPEPEDDGWEFHWNPNDQSYWFYNRFTGVWQQENPRVPGATASATTSASTTTTSTNNTAAAAKTALSNPASIAGGYNPAIHGDYDENAWYAQNLRAATNATSTAATTTNMFDSHHQHHQQLYEQGGEYMSAGFFNRRTGQWQSADQGPERHSDEAKSRRQLRAFFDVDAAANDMHDGRSLRAERAGRKLSRAELRAFKERRRAKKEEKRRAWLRD